MKCPKNVNFLSIGKREKKQIENTSTYMKTNENTSIGNSCKRAQLIQPFKAELFVLYKW